MPPEVLQMLLWIAIIGLIFWLLIIRPAQRRQKEVASLQSAISVGDEVMLTSGVYGTITSVSDSTVMLEVAPGVTLKVARGAVGSIVRDEPGPAAPGSTDQSAPESPDEQEER